VHLQRSGVVRGGTKGAAASQEISGKFKTLINVL